MKYHNSLYRIKPIAEKWVLFVLVYVFAACKHPTESNPYPYTPDDFSNLLRDLLKKIEQHNIVYLTNAGCRGSGEIYDAAQIYVRELESKASLKELHKVTKCTNPAIRAYALQILVQDSATDPMPLVRAHMYDTAIIFDDYSNRKGTVISLLLLSTEYWCCKGAKSEIEREVLEKQPFELASYHLIDAEHPMDTFPGFYNLVRKMAQNLEDNNFNSIVNWQIGKGAIERLASYQYEEDIPLLYSLIESSLYYANGYFIPAKTIINFPAPEFDVFYLDTSVFWRRQFNFLRLEPYFQLRYTPIDGLYDFIKVVIQHKSNKSAKMLEKILEQSPLDFAGKWELRNLEDEKNNLYNYIAEGIRMNDNPHYDKLKKMTEKYLTEKQGKNLQTYRTSFSDDGYSSRRIRPVVQPYQAFWWE